MRPAVRACLAALLLVSWLAAAPPASAQADNLLGRPVAEVRLVIDGQAASDAELRAVLETRPGEALQAASVRESIVHLMALNRFENVQVDAQENGRGVVLTYALVPLRTVRAIEFRGQLGLTEDEVRGEVVDRYGVSPPPGRANDIASTLEGIYRDHGYLRPAIVPHVVPRPDPTRVTLTFDIQAGPQARIAAIDFVESDPALNREEVLRRLQLRLHAPYDPVAVAARVSSYTDALRAKGFYEANIAVTPRPSADDEAVALDVTAARGPYVSIELRGDPIPADKRKELVPAGDARSIDQDLLEDWSANIERYFQAQGYKEARAPWTREQGRNGRETIVFTVARGPRYVVDSVEVTGNKFFDTAALAALVGLQPGEPLVQRTLDAGVGKILARYQRQGFTAANAKATVTVRATAGGEIRQAVGLAIGEGPRTMVRSINFVCNGAAERCAIPDGRMRGALMQPGPAGFTVVPGTPFYQPDIDKAREVLLLEYLNRGYELASIAVPPLDRMTNEERTEARVRFDIQEGPQIRVDHILLVGNNRTKASTIRNELVFKPGDPLAYDKLTESQQRLTALGLFRRVRISELQHGTEEKRDVLVTVEESPATSVAYGGGVEMGRRLRDVNGTAVPTTEIAPHGLFEIGRRNLGGKNRSLNFNGSLGVRPNLSSGQIVGAGLREYRALGTYREPRLFGYRADLLVSGGIEQAVRTSYSYNRRGFRGELARRLSPSLSVYGRYSLDETHILAEQVDEREKLLVDRLFPQVRISRLSASLVRDTRDDALDPSRGILASVEAGVAPRFIGSEVGFTKGQGQLFVYRQLPTGPRIVFAGGARVGLAAAFEQIKNGVVTQELPISERFFSGDAVRGFIRDALGPLTSDGFPQGGDALMVVNGELRMTVWKGLMAVGFVDAGNVFARAGDLDPTDLRPSVGFGLRYKSPLGPIRVDLGFNPSRRTIAGVREQLAVWYFGIGQAF